MPLLVPALYAITTTLTAYRTVVAGMQPTSQIFGRTLVEAYEDPGAMHQVALTYDDGPSPRNTPALLDLLARHGARATFFVVGEHLRRHPALARRIAAEGHLIANHTQTHPNLAKCLPGRVQRELDLCQHTIADVIGITPRFFRPPFGARRWDVHRIAAAMGLESVLWNVTGFDWKLIGAAAITAKLRAGVTANRVRRRSTNILLHDGSHLDGRGAPLDRSDSIAATAALLNDPGLEFVTVDRFLDRRANPTRDEPEPLAPAGPLPGTRSR